MKSSWKSTFALLSLFAGAEVGLAQEESLPTFQFGSELHFNFFYSDDGLNDLDTPERSASKRFGVGTNTAKVLFRSKITDNLNFVMRHNLLNGNLEFAYISHQTTSALNLTVGRTKERIFGWHRRDTGGLTPIVGSFIGLKPFDYPDGLQVTYKKGKNQFLVQIVRDFFDCSSDPCESWNQRDADGQLVQKQPAILAEWIGSFGSLYPLIQYASYDLGKSSTWSAGLRYLNQRYNIHADYVNDSRLKRAWDGVEASGEKNTLTAYVIHGVVNMGKYSPFFHFSSFDYDQYTAPGTPAIEVNSRYTRFDDNNVTWGIGSHFNKYSDSFRPYVMLVSRSGDFVDAKNPTKSVNLSEMRTILGLTSSF